jgi:hypothetical protein
MLEEIVRLFNVLNPSEPLSRHFYGYLRVLSQVSRSFREQSMRLDMTWLLPGNVNRVGSTNMNDRLDYTSRTVRNLFGLSGPAISDEMARQNAEADCRLRPRDRGMTHFLHQVQYAVQEVFNPRSLVSRFARPLIEIGRGLPYDFDAPRGGRGKQQRRSRQISSNDGPVVVPPPSVATLLGSGPSAGGWPVNLNGDGRSAEHENFLARFDARMRASRERTRQGKKRKQGDQ